MRGNGHLDARKIRGKLGHPIVDADGHWLEYEPVMFSSDIGHFDVPDMGDVVPEADELVEHGLLTDADSRDFMFANAVRFWGEVNPDFFTGTAIEKQAALVLAGTGGRA